MPQDSYTFTGYAHMGWPSYRDTGTGRMLEADPGDTCTIEALEPGLPMPPSLQWVPATKADVKAAAAKAADTSQAATASAPGGDI